MTVKTPPFGPKKIPIDADLLMSSATGVQRVIDCDYGVIYLFAFEGC
jgi:hypothetical protein